MTSSRIEPVAPTGETLEWRLDVARRQARGGPEDLVLVQIEAPCAAPEALLQRFGECDGILWSSPDGASFAGFDVAYAIECDGPGSFERVRRGAAELWQRLRSSEGGPVLEAPRIFGGFAFTADAPRDAGWSGFGSARFVLPRVAYTYTRHSGRALLTLAIERRELDRAQSSRHVDLFERVYQTALSLPVVAQGGLARATSSAEPPRALFEARVSDAVRRIQASEMQKVVAAREVRLGFGARIDPVATVNALREQAPDCLRFMFRFGDAAFIGAPPELLVRKLGRALETEAVAGTIDADADSPESRLQASAKDLEEHELVVAAISSALAPVCERTQLPERPGVRRLKRLLHLCTPIVATLSRDAHVTELVERLHPTPAVGGVPTQRALEWIRCTESFERGWYSGAVGWFDAQGDGQFNVALRSALICGDQARLYAGAGIVRDSVASAEYDETTLKLAAVLASLRQAPART